LILLYIFLLKFQRFALGEIYKVYGDRVTKVTKPIFYIPFGGVISAAFRRHFGQIKTAGRMIVIACCLIGLLLFCFDGYLYLVYHDSIPIYWIVIVVANIQEKQLNFL